MEPFDPELSALRASGGTEDASTRDRRAERILARARDEAAVKDLLAFGLVKSWSVVLAVAGVLFALVGRAQSQGQSQGRRA